MQVVKRFAKCLDDENPSLCPPGSRDELLLSSSLFDVTPLPSPECREKERERERGRERERESEGERDT